MPSTIGIRRRNERATTNSGASPRGARDRGCHAYRAGIENSGARCPAYRVRQVREEPVTGDATPTRGASPRGAFRFTRIPIESGRDRGCHVYRAGIENSGARCPAYRVRQVREDLVTGDAPSRFIGRAIFHLPAKIESKNGKL